MGVELISRVKNLNRDSVKTWLMTTSLSWPHCRMLFVATNVLSGGAILDEWPMNVEPIVEKFLMGRSGLALQKSDESNHGRAFRVTKFLLQT